MDKPTAVGAGMLCGVHAIPVRVEATLRGSGTPRILGSVDTVVREAYHRLLTAFPADGLEPPRGCPTINFSPANLRKTGSGFDLPMALALAGAAGHYPSDRAATVTALGELGLDGAVLPVRGAVPVAIAAARTGRRDLLLAERDARLAALVPGVRAFAVARLAQAIAWLRGTIDLSPAEPAAPPPPAAVADLADIRGHETAKTALQVAAAGNHNTLLVGPPGSGKSALLRRLPGLLPAASPGEQLEIMAIGSLRAADGCAPAAQRPVRCPHHTSSFVSLLGGGPELRPGEVTLAHRGVLFLDELAEFRREALEALRQPLEDAKVSVGRARGVIQMPADFLFVAAMNPCPCGYWGHRGRACVCGPSQRRRYAARISGPLLDRLDLQVALPQLSAAELAQPADARWSTAALRAPIDTARARQAARSPRSPVPNSRLGGELLEAAIGPDQATRTRLDALVRRHHLSGRARERLLRVARTVADLDDRDTVTVEDLLAAARLRGLHHSPTE